MSFFDSEYVRAEMAEIQELQEEVYSNVFKFAYMDKEQQLDHIDLLESLMEKQRVLYTRLSLSDDPETDRMLKQIRRGIDDLGFPKNVDVNVVFKQMTDAISVMRDKIDKTSSDV
tara:strand:+ start:249 stop:593 length:345 start_codon:yes stop_codon:yes gene_type:complete